MPITPREQKAVKVAAETFRPNPAFDCFEAITQLGVGEALVSTLGAKGVPSMVERTLVRPPSSRLGPIAEPERVKVMAVSPVAGQYDADIDRDSAYEMLQRRAAEAAKAEDEERQREEEEDRKPPEGRRWTLPGYERDDDDDDDDNRRSTTRKTSSRSRRPGYQRQTVTEAVIKSVARSAAHVARPGSGAGHSRIAEEGVLIPSRLRPRGSGCVSAPGHRDRRCPG